MRMVMPKQKIEKSRHEVRITNTNPNLIKLAREIESLGIAPRGSLNS